jgi:hypothetical protein
MGKKVRFLLRRLSPKYFFEIADPEEASGVIRASVIDRLRAVADTNIANRAAPLIDDADR